MGILRRKEPIERPPLEGADQLAWFMIMGYELGKAEERGLTGDERDEWGFSLASAASEETGNDRLLFRRLGTLLAENNPNPEDEDQFERYLRAVGYMDARRRIMRRVKKWGY